MTDRAALPTLGEFLTAHPAVRVCDPTKLDPFDIPLDQAALLPAVRLMMRIRVASPLGEEELTLFAVTEALLLRDRLSLERVLARFRGQAEAMCRDKFGTGRAVWRADNELAWVSTGVTIEPPTG